MEKSVNFVSKIKSLSDNDNFTVLSESETRNIKGGKTLYWKKIDGKWCLITKN